MNLEVRPKCEELECGDRSVCYWDHGGISYDTHCINHCETCILCGLPLVPLVAEDVSLIDIVDVVCADCCDLDNDTRGEALYRRIVIKREKTGSQYDDLFHELYGYVLCVLQKEGVAKEYAFLRIIVQKARVLIKEKRNRNLLRLKWLLIRQEGIDTRDLPLIQFILDCI
jgi:hypothetical protein